MNHYEPWPLTTDMMSFSSKHHTHMNHYRSWPWTQYPCHVVNIPTWTIMDLDHGHNIPVIYAPYPHELLWTMTMDTMSLSFRHHTYMNHFGPWPWTQYPCHLGTLPTWTFMDHDHWPLTQCPCILSTIPTWTIMDLYHGSNSPVIKGPYPHNYYGPNFLKCWQCQHFHRHSPCIFAQTPKLSDWNLDLHLN